MNIIDALHNTFFENVPAYSGAFDGHLHESYNIGFTSSGFFKAFSDKKQYDAYQYSVRITNPYDIHGGEMEACHYTTFYPSVPFLENIYEQIHGEKKAPIFPNHIFQDGVLYGKLFYFFQAVYSKSDPMWIETCLVDALSYLVIHYASKNTMVQSPSCSLLKHSLAYIHDNITTTISLETLAKEANLSKYHFLRQFKERVGVTPHHYILQAKVQKAKDLILGGMPILEASLETGFSDQSHFTRNFKKTHGYTPGALRNERNFILYR